MRVTIPNARLAFPALFTAKTVNGEGDPAFSATFLLDPVANKAAIAAVNKAIDAVGTDKWGQKAEKIVADCRKTGRVCLRSGDEKTEYDGFEGMMFISARSKSRPTVVDRDKTPLTEQDGRPYGGCFVNAIVELWAQDNQFGKRINATLAGVQFLKDGDAFGGSRPADPDEFEAVDDNNSDLV